VLPCALANYLVNRMAYDESTAWFRVQHCLKPLRPLKKKLNTFHYRNKQQGQKIMLIHTNHEEM